MGITGSLPLRWSNPAKSGVKMGSTDSKGMSLSKLTFMFLIYFLCPWDVDNCSKHPQLVPTIPIPNHSHVSSSVTTTTLIGSSQLKSLGCRTDSSCIINVDHHSEGSKHVNHIRCSIDSGVTHLGLKCSRDSNTSNVSIPVKRCRGPESGPKFTQSSNVQTLVCNLIVFVTNCSFGNLKSRRFFPRSLVEDVWNGGLDCTCSTGARGVLRYSNEGCSRKTTVDEVDSVKTA
ncbi:hypothetical protein HETIRDRAFT_306129 [Heterobasidion irregulare TC 32-1]|uniref:Uncharacterized protein n=1 Tax=Heterobasidion irregulare (strain TC 32-1) TaxID=747525 RepID=W4KKT9_HETIT|nr:uncharacterized protein HETIRDRAFT_306129 [Heterobasidion irregulare TC 32-1]ETW86468.1 hypothetical protein HETIRDRAFT_306129 [Heterobasidion irregulare TC 32-1]